MSLLKKMTKKTQTGSEIVQSFPRKNTAGGIDRRSFTVDLDGARRAGGLRCGEERLALEAAEMAVHFPRWILTLAVGRERVLCPSCQGPLVFDRGLRCAICERKTVASSVPKGAQLAWFGLLPPIGIDGLARLKPRLLARTPDQHVVGFREEIGHYLLVPLVAIYPADFPEGQVRIAYQKGLFEVPGMPPEQPSHSVHLLGQGFMCLFAPGQWLPDLTLRRVLQQRAYAHVIKLLNYSDGKKAAFAIVS